MRKLLLFTTASLFFFSCSNKETNNNVDTLIASKNLVSIQAKRAELQSQITKLDEAIAGLDTKKEEALVAVATVKDTVFSHFLKIPGTSG